MSQPPILIGSRAFAFHFDRDHPRLPHRKAHDWDVSGTFDNFKRWVQDHTSDIIDISERRLESGDKNLDLVPEKFVARLRNGAVVEWEVEELIGSADSLRRCGGKDLDKVAIGTYPEIQFSRDQAALSLLLPDEIPLALFKLAHVFWPINWRKTALDLAAFWRSFPTIARAGLSPSALIQQADQSKTDFLQVLWNKRLGEAAGRYHRTQGSNPTHSLLGDDICKSFDSIDKKSPQRYQFIEDLVTKTAKEQFLASLLDGSDKTLASWLSDPSVTLEKLTNELWLLALESICTNIRVKSFQPPVKSGALFHQSADDQIMMKLYEQIHFDVPESYKRINRKDEGVPLWQHRIMAYQTPTKPRINGLSTADVSRLYPHTSSELVGFLVRNLPDLIAPSAAFTEAVKTELGARFGPTPELPVDIWQVIMTSHSHRLLASMSQVCKSFQIIARRSWDHFTLKCWSSQRLAKFEDRRSNTGDKFRAAFEDRVDELRVAKWGCIHCGTQHDCITHDEWRAYLTDPKKDWEFQEFAEYWCICPDCDTNSWAECEQYRAMFSDE